MPIDLTAYFARIGYQGPRDTSFETLSAVVRRHLYSIPFENLDALMGVPVELDPDSLERKMVQSRRGGYCYESNGLLLEALEMMGFAPTPMSARVRLGVPAGVMTPISHMNLRIELDGHPWLVDVAFGAASPSTPLRLDTEEPQETPHGLHRLNSQPSGLMHQVMSANGWIDAYLLTGQEMYFIDRQVANWWTSRHPSSRFVKEPFCSRAYEDGTRASILGTEFTHRRAGDVLETFAIRDSEHLLAILTNRFDLHFPPETAAMLRPPVPA